MGGLEFGAGFLVYIEDGKLHALEGYTYEEPWPASPEPFALRYSNDSRPAVRQVFG